ncbi:hypothetical protein CDAR_234251 [Caerostris darwini]|uniref:Uncharacterized protein n=1 Tax=Caerostris darwini TaxID=1538125 RepID=A0AAV4QH85_9ARAC|nr:hypothetical protein CDAR_234251 [Caerostris darwini]
MIWGVAYRALQRHTLQSDHVMQGIKSLHDLGSGLHSIEVACLAVNISSMIWRGAYRALQWHTLQSIYRLISSMI